MTEHEGWTAQVFADEEGAWRWHVRDDQVAARIHLAMIVAHATTWCPRSYTELRPVAQGIVDLVVNGRRPTT